MFRFKSCLYNHLITGEFNLNIKFKFFHILRDLVLIVNRLAISVDRVLWPIRTALGTWQTSLYYRISARVTGGSCSSC